MTPADEPERLIDRQAAEWLVRRDRGLSAAEQDEFFAWLAADPRHGAQLAEHQRTWRQFNLLAEWRPEHSAEPNPDLLAKLPRRARWLAWAAPLALAAALAVAFLLAGRTVVAPGGASAPASALAEGPRVLDDGSTVDLRGDSEIRVAYTATERRVELVRGEAFFTVAKNPARPFIVRAHGVDVRAVGTAFNVRLNPDHVEVLVTEGKVQVAPPEIAERTALITPVPEPPRLVAAGQRAIVSTAVAAAPVLPRVAEVSTAEIARELAWQPRLLDFNSTPLGEVVAEFNSRNRVHLVLADPTLAALPIVASVRSDNVEGFVRLLEATAGVEAERRGDTITLRATR